MADVVVSLVIPTYRREELLVDTLRSSLAQDRQDYEIIVVDQTPRHEVKTEKFLAAHRTRIQRITFSPPSLTAARNAGIRAARGKFIVFVDDDTSFEPDFLSRHLEAHGDNVGAVQGRVVEAGGREETRPAWINSWIRFCGGNNCTREGKTNNLTGCNFSLSWAVIREVGFSTSATRELQYTKTVIMRCVCLLPVMPCALHRSPALFTIARQAAGSALTPAAFFQSIRLLQRIFVCEETFFASCGMGLPISLEAARPTCAS